MAERVAQLTPRLLALKESLLQAQQQQTHWHGDLAVLLLQRAWLRLEVVRVTDLARVLPPDASAEAPELVRFRHWRRLGRSALEAQELCWQEFGREACSDALRRFWRAQESGNHGWTLPNYLHLLDRYRQGIEAPGPSPLPLLVLARPGTPDEHRLEWCWPQPQPMGHTCA
jgi:hypothetical protein